MSLKQRLQEELKEALRARDEQRKAVIRMALAAITYAEVDDDAGMVAVLRKEAKQRRETIAELQNAGRPELAQEEAELAILEEYLPRLLSREEIADVGATGMKQMGPVMSQLKGRADGRVVNKVNEIVRELLAG